MVALRSFCGPDGDADERGRPVGRDDAADWLSLQQTACELGVSLSTVRRMIRRGKIRNRIVPRPGGFSYLLYVPNSRHALIGAHHHLDAPPRSVRSGMRLVDAEFERDAPGGAVPHSGEIRRVQAQVRQLSHALTRAVQSGRQPAPPRRHDAAPDPAAPYARFRALARKRRWWRF